MKPLHTVIAAVLTALLLVTMASAADGPDADRLLSGLQDWLDRSSTLSGRFEQSLVSGAFGEGIQESGLIWIQRPGRMRWEYTDPEAKTAILNGNSTLFYEQEAQQMMVGSLDDGGRLLAALLAGQERLADLFTAERIRRPDLTEGRGWFLRLVPGHAEEAFEEVTLFLGRKYQLRAVEVLDASGNRVLYRFSDLNRNSDIPEGIFEFEPPEGTEILGEATGS
jgi:outer membrane lipoprotein carrier protein